MNINGDRIYPVYPSKYTLHTMYIYILVCSNLYDADEQFMSGYDATGCQAQCGSVRRIGAQQCGAYNGSARTVSSR